MADTQETIKCPCCSKDMKKVFIKEAECYVDICTDGCGAIFFDNRELKKFDKENNNIDEILSTYKNKSYKKVDEDAVRICPVCNTKMVKHYATKRHEVQIDECYNCGGILLDYGELETIRSLNAELDREKTSSSNIFRDIDMSEFQDYKAKSVNETFSRSRVGMINIFRKLF